jgi:predicted AlkP superfamily pyrophosphatase or phosphodiesterase
MNELPSFIELEKELRAVYKTRLLYFGPPVQRVGATDHAIEYIKGLSVETQHSCKKAWLIVYVDVLDHRGHGYGVGSTIWNSTLTSVDNKMRELYITLENLLGTFTFTIFSDHGMYNVEHTIDIMKQLRLIGLGWRSITMLVDATIVNIWLERQINKVSLQKALERVAKDRFIVFNKEDDRSTLQEVGVPLNSTYSGDLIIQARPGYMFYPNSYSDRKCFKGAHGYFPDEKCQQSFLNLNINPEKDLAIKPTHIKDIRRLVLKLVSKNLT